MLKIIGIGNALMDIIVPLQSDDLLINIGLQKGSMTLIDNAELERIDSLTSECTKSLTPGGSVANTIHGIAALGGSAAFIGKVGADELGAKYNNELKNAGAETLLFTSETPTGRAIALITADSERTFGTFLGAAVELSPNDLTATLFQGYNIAYIEGYLVQNHDLIRKAVALAKAEGLKIALDLASFNVVNDNISFLKEIVAEYVDILFANEDEAFAFTGKEPYAAVNELSEQVEIAVVKIGSKGSLVKWNGVVTEVGVTSTNCIDTTGAGDLYAAGFLFGLANGFSIEKSSAIASIVAGKVIQIYGARIEEQTWNEIRNFVKTL